MNDCRARSADRAVCEAARASIALSVLIWGFAAGHELLATGTDGGLGLPATRGVVERLAADLGGAPEVQDAVTIPSTASPASGYCKIVADARARAEAAGLAHLSRAVELAAGATGRAVV